MMIYLFLVNITLTVCYLLYRVFFRRLTFFQWNRRYLLSALVVSLLIPIGLFVDISSNRFIEEQLPTIDISSLVMDEIMVGSDKQHAISLRDGGYTIYWIGVAVAISWLIFRFFKVIQAVKRNENEFSFAFFHRIVLSEKAQGNPSILAHEHVHVEQGHSYDVLFLEIASVFNWFNPLFHSYLRELKFQHECIADELCSVDKIAYAELLVAQAMQVDQVHFLHEFSNKSILKNRIAMLFKDKSKHSYKFLYFSIVPVILLALLSTLVFNTSKAKNMVLAIESKVERATLDNMGQQLLPDVPHQQFHSVAGHNKTEPLCTDVEQLRTVLGAWALSSFGAEKDEKDLVSFQIKVEKDGRASAAFAMLGKSGKKLRLSADQLKHIRWKPATDKGKAVPAWASVYASFQLNAHKSESNVNLTPTEPNHRFTEKQRDNLKESADDKLEQEKIFTAVEVNPEPIGGINNFRKWIGANYKYPQEAIDASLTGLIVVSFIVEADGALSNLKVIKDLEHGTGEAALDVLRQAANWRPAIQNGRNVRVAYTLPLMLGVSP